MWTSKSYQIYNKQTLITAVYTYIMSQKVLFDLSGLKRRKEKNIIFLYPRAF
jgi:hypothetical protein